MGKIQPLNNYFSVLGYDKDEDGDVCGTKAWKISLKDGDIDIENIDPPPSSGLFLRVTCLGIVGIKKTKEKWYMHESIGPDDEPWYKLSVVGCYPNVMIYKDGEAYWVIGIDINNNSICSHINEYVDPNRKAVINKEQIEKAIDEWMSIMD